MGRFAVPPFGIVGSLERSREPRGALQRSVLPFFEICERRALTGRQRAYCQATERELMPTAAQSQIVDWISPRGLENMSVATDFCIARST